MNLSKCVNKSSVQSYKASTSVNCNSRVVFTSKLLLFTTVEMYIMIDHIDHRLTTGRIEIMMVTVV